MTVSPVGDYPYAPHMTIPSGEILIAYARYSTNEQDLTAQRLAEQDRISSLTAPPAHYQAPAVGLIPE